MTKRSNRVVANAVSIGLAVSVVTGLAVTEEATIVSPESPLPSVVTTESKTDQDAAADLCDYLSRVTGRKVTVAAAPAAAGAVIHVGRDPFVTTHAPEIEKLFADGYILKYLHSEERDHVILAGRMGPSSQWAVEQFLKDYCGVRWLFPDPEYGEIVPSRPTIAIESTLSRTFEPDYLTRANCGMYYFTPARVYLRLRPYGGGANYGSHALQYIFSTQEFAAHPEWFAFFKGKRQWWKYGNGWQICTTNPGTVEHAVKYALDHFRKNPDSPMVSVGQNDGSGWCECPACTEFINSFDPPFTITERWFHWVNQVAREVAKTHPGKWVEAMAYSATSMPPRFPLEENVAVTKTIEFSSELKQAEDWQKVCQSVNLYSYMYGRSFFGFRHYPHAARDFLKWGHDTLGALAHVTECGGDWTFDGPKYHYLQALQWDVNADVDEVMRDFCAHSYGRAAGPMRSFWDTLEKVYERRKPVPYGMENRRLLFYQWVSWQRAVYIQPNDEFSDYTLHDVELLDGCIAEATRLAADDTEGVRFRVERMSDAWKYCRTMLVSCVNSSNAGLDTEVTSEKSRDEALKRAREIADSRLQRRYYGGKLRAYRNINPRMRKPHYWSTGAALTLFSHERALLDDLCTGISDYMKKGGGVEAALTFWRAIPASDSLEQSARTQIYMLSRGELPNLLANGDFETGALTGWEAQGYEIGVVGQGARRGKYAAECRGGKNDVLSQSVAVSPGERYRLTAWGKYVTVPPDWAVPLEAEMEFYSGATRVWSEPTRCTLRTKDPAAGWAELLSTATVPPGAESVVVKLTRTFRGTTLWDDVAFEKIMEGPPIVPGTIVDTFDGRELDRAKWFQATSTGGTRAPEIDEGRLIYGGDRMVYPLTSYAAFDDLLKYEGEERYCLRLHAAALPDRSQHSALTLGIKSGTGPSNIKDSGMFWTHHFPTQKRRKGYLLTYAYENGVRTHSGHYVPQHLAKDVNEIWYVLYFDPLCVAVYAASDGYDDTETSLVARYEHKIKNVTDKGSIYLKLSSGSYMLDEIGLRKGIAQ